MRTTYHIRLQNLPRASPCASCTNHQDHSQDRDQTSEMSVAVVAVVRSAAHAYGVGVAIGIVCATAALMSLLLHNMIQEHQRVREKRPNARY